METKTELIQPNIIQKDLHHHKDIQFWQSHRLFFLKYLNPKNTRNGQRQSILKGAFNHLNPHLSGPRALLTGGPDPLQGPIKEDPLQGLIKANPSQGLIKAGQKRL